MALRSDKVSLWEELLSDDLLKVAKAVDEHLEKAGSDEHKSFARVAERYYDADHDIRNNRIFYIDDHGGLKEDTFASNVKIPHAFFTELVDQKVQFMLSNGVRFETENEALSKALEEYIDEDFMLFVNEVVEGASVKGREFAYARTDVHDILRFQTSDMLTTDTIVNDDHEEVAVIRHYTRVLNKGKSKTVKVMYVEVYTEKDIRYFIKEDDKKAVPNPAKQLNPQPHVIAITDDGELLSRSYGRIPFYRLANNRKELSDLKPIKALIDDYDRMACFLSNNLEDYDKPIYVVSGFRGDDLSKLRQNIKGRGVVDVGSPNQGGSVELKAYQIPYEARKAKMAISKEGIYKFGMGFDSSQTGDGNITNIVIKSRYSLLDLKCDKMEPRLKSMLKWCLEMIFEDMKRRGKGSYSVADVEITFDRSTLVNESDQANRELVEAQAKHTLISALVAIQPYVDNETFLRQVCDALDIDIDQVLEAVEYDGFESEEGKVGAADEAQSMARRNGEAQAQG